MAVAEACLAATQLDEAEAAACEALTWSRQLAERASEASVLRLLGEIASHQYPADDAKAEAHYSAALAKASDLGMRPLVARCHVGLARLYRRTGKPEHSQDHFATALTMYREMDMTYWQQKTERERADLGSGAG